VYNHGWPALIGMCPSGHPSMLYSFLVQITCVLESKLSLSLSMQPAAARGIGVRVISKWSEVPKRRPVIVQHYIALPYLINSSKFDLRIYVYVTCYDPLRVYLYSNGLARFASVKYDMLPFYFFLFAIDSKDLELFATTVLYFWTVRYFKCKPIVLSGISKC